MISNDHRQVAWVKEESPRFIGVECQRNNVSNEYHETAIVSFPLIQLEKAYQTVLTRRQGRGAPDLRHALITALHHICPKPLRGCHDNGMHLLQDLLKYELAGGLCFACQGKTYGWLRKKGWEH